MEALTQFTYFRSLAVAAGPFHLAALVILFLSSLILHLKLPVLQEDSAQYKIMKRSLWFLIPVIICSASIVGFVGYWDNLKKIEIFILIALIQSVAIQMYPFYFILNHPNLKEYFKTTLKEWAKSKIIFCLTPNPTTWKNVFLLVFSQLTFNLFYEYKWPKMTQTQPNNQIIPI